MKNTAAFPEPNYTQTPNTFFEMLQDMGDAELRVTLVMIRHTFGYHRDGFKMGVGKLAKRAGLSRQGALDGAQAAETRGTFRRSNPEEITEAKWELVVEQSKPLYSVDTPLQSVEGTPLASRGQVGLKKDIKEIDREIAAIFQKIESLKFTIDPKAAYFVENWLTDFKDAPNRLEIIFRALDETSRNGAKSLKYTDKILVGWAANGVPPTRYEQKSAAKSNGQHGRKSTASELSAALAELAAA